MNNEPVAWMWNEDGCNLGVVLDQDKQIGKQEFQDYNIPLYTHPAKTKELLDEIEDLKLQNKYLKGCESNIEIVAENEALKAKVKWYDDTFRLPTDTHPAKTLTDRIAELEKLVSQRFDDGKRLGIIETEDMFLKAKTLTDEEIWKELITVKHTWIATTSVWFEFEREELTKAIRAILRKAQEK